MIATYRRILIGTGVAIAFLGLAILEIVNERLPLDGPSTAVVNPARELARLWQTFFDTQGRLLSLTAGAVGGWGRGEMARSAGAEGR